MSFVDKYSAQVLEEVEDHTLHPYKTPLIKRCNVPTMLFLHEDTDRPKEIQSDRPDDQKGTILSKVIPKVGAQQAFLERVGSRMASFDGRRVTK